MRLHQHSYLPLAICMIVCICFGLSRYKQLGKMIK